MPAALPGESTANVSGNPSVGLAVIFDLLSGPKGSPKDMDTGTYASTGALATGIGYGPTFIIAGSGSFVNIVAYRGFDYQEIAGTYNPANSAMNSAIMYIGGGKTVASAAKKGVPFTPLPYTSGHGFGCAGNGGARDAGAGPAFTGFTMQMLNASGSTPNGSAISGAFNNRSGVTIAASQLAFGVNTAASAVPS